MGSGRASTWHNADARDATLVLQVGLVRVQVVHCQTVRLYAQEPSVRGTLLIVPNDLAKYM
jgi:hypothetical protein